ncbi:hypothetical protein L2E82_11561 [Cichorium intybus]|uniref:Uncharacterized protein n=1 Tax=Cichorium intybus TaxID=13427 RepID=A0ACB9GDF2_CICIN|nr:hypothetical protein L2E82_11561 [Cichorium intybus]
MILCVPSLSPALASPIFQYKHRFHHVKATVGRRKIEKMEPAEALSSDTTVMEPCPKPDIPNLKELLNEENFYLTTEEGDQGRLPVVILSMKENKHSKSPAVIFLHCTNTCKEWLRPLLEVGIGIQFHSIPGFCSFASCGYVVIHSAF